MAFRNATYDLLSNAGATGPVVEWPGGKGAFVTRGTFGGATVQLRWSIDNVNWLPVDASGDTFVTKTAAGSGNFELPPCFLQAVVSGGAPSGLYASALRIG